LAPVLKRRLAVLSKVPQDYGGGGFQYIDHNTPGFNFSSYTYPKI